MKALREVTGEGHMRDLIVDMKGQTTAGTWDKEPSSEGVERLEASARPQMANWVALEKEKEPDLACVGRPVSEL